MVYVFRYDLESFAVERTCLGINTYIGMWVSLFECIPLLYGVRIDEV